MENNNLGQELAKQTLDQIPQIISNAKQIVGLVKEGGRITGYQHSDNSIVEKQQAVDMASPVSVSLTGEILNTSNPSPTAVNITTLVTSLPFLLIPKDNSLTDSIPQNTVGLFFVYSSAQHALNSHN